MIDYYCKHTRLSYRKGWLHILCMCLDPCDISCRYRDGDDLAPTGCCSRCSRWWWGFGCWLQPAVSTDRYGDLSLRHCRLYI